MKCSMLALVLGLAASPAAADYIEVFPYHLNTDPGRVTMGILTTGDKGALNTLVANEQTCVMLAFTAAMTRQTASVACMNDTSQLVNAYVCRAQRTTDENRDRDTPTCFRYRP